MWFAIWAWGIFAYNMGVHDGQPDCHEDEVYAVQHDPNPTHGLTWACVNVEEWDASHR